MSEDLVLDVQNLSVTIDTPEGTVNPVKGIDL